MKKVIILLCALLIPACFAGLARAGIELPKNCYRLNQLNLVQQKAKQEKKPIAFLYTDKDSTDEGCNQASELIIKTLEKKTLIIYLKDISQAPEKVAASFNSRGALIPKVAVFDSGMKKELGLVTLEDIEKQGNKAFKLLKRSLRKY